MFFIVISFFDVVGMNVVAVALDSMSCAKRLGRHASRFLKILGPRTRKQARHDE